MTLYWWKCIFRFYREDYRHKTLQTASFTSASQVTKIKVFLLCILLICMYANKNALRALRPCVLSPVCLPFSMSFSSTINRSGSYIKEWFPRNPYSHPSSKISLLIGLPVPLIVSFRCSGVRFLPYFSAYQVFFCGLVRKGTWCTLAPGACLILLIVL